MYETYIGKTIGDHIHDFKTRMNNHITDGRIGVSTCKFPIHVFNQNKHFLYITLFHKKRYDTLSNPSRSIIH